MKSLKRTLWMLMAGALLLSNVYSGYGQTTVTIGSGTSSSGSYPFASFWDYGWSASIYLAGEISAPGGVVVTSLAWYVANTPANYTMINQSVYLSHTTASDWPSGSTQPSTAGMTLVYQGDITYNGSGWHTLNLQVPFAYNGTDNLLVYIDNYDGDYLTGYPTFRYTSMSPNYMMLYRATDNSYPSGGGTRSTARSNIQITYISPPPLDGAMTAITGPVAPAPPGANPVVATLANFGTNPINSATIQWKVNGVAGAPFSYAGPPLASFASTAVTLGNGNFLNGNNNVVAWIANVNGGADPNPLNDTAKATILACNPLSGIYTIGPTGNFASFNQAYDALVLCGIGGPVTFNVASGTYDEQLTLQELPGMSAINHVTFQSASGNPADVVLQYDATASASNWVVLFDGGDFFTLADMTLTSGPNTTYGKVLVYQNTAEFNTVDNCILNGDVTTSSSTERATIYSSGTNYANYNTVSNCQINNGYYGVYFYGGSSSPNNGNMFTGNTLNGFYYYGIYFQYQKNGVIDGNTLVNSSPASSTIYGIRFAYNDSTNSLSGNKVLLSSDGTSYGLYVYDCDGDPANYTTVSNNFVQLNTGTSSHYGIYSYNGDFLKYYHNTVNVAAGDGSGSEYGFYVSSSSSGANYGSVEVKNNIFMNTGGGLAAYVTSSAAGLPYIVDMNYNDYWTTATQLADWGGTACFSLAEWQTASGFDANGRNLNPVLASGVNPTPVSLPLDNKGTPIPAVSSDIFGNPRSATMPDIGCVEYTAPTNPIMVLSDTLMDFGIIPFGAPVTWPLTISNVGPQSLVISGKSIAAPFSINLNPAPFILIPSGGSANFTVTFNPTVSGVYDQYLQINSNTTVLQTKVHLKAESYHPNALIEDFEGLTTPFPEGWTILQSPCSVNDVIVYNSSTYAYSPTNSLRFRSYTSGCTSYEQYAITPRLETDAANRKFSFWYRTYSLTWSDTLWVGWSSTGNNVATDFTWGDMFEVTNLTYQQYVKTDVPIGTKYIALKYNGDAADYVYIDDVFGPPVYVYPYDVKLLRVDGDASIVTGNSHSYKVEVQNKGTNADLYNLSVVSAKGFSYAIRNKQDNANISSISVPAGAKDTVIVKASLTAGGVAMGDIDTAMLFAASSNDLTEKDSVAFYTTAYVPFIPPYMEDFPSTTFPPQYWAEAEEWLDEPVSQWDDVFSDWFYDDWLNVSGTPFGRSARLDLDGTSTTPDYDWLISPIFDLGAKSVYKLEFDVAMTDDGTTGPSDMQPDDTLALLISTDAGASWSLADTLMLWTAGKTPSLTGDHHVIDLTPYTGLVRFAFYGQSTVPNPSTMDPNLYVDNFALVDPTAVPGCITTFAPADQSIDLPSTLTLSWGQIPNTTSYNLYLGTSNPPPFLMNVGDTNQHEVAGLMNDVTYYWKVVPQNAIGMATGCPVWSFTTIAKPMISDFPWMETFEGFTTGAPGVVTPPWSISPTTGFRWQVNSGGTSSLYTGPTVDHTTGTAQGIYMYTEATSGSTGSEAILQRDSIDFSAVSSAYMLFWYHMHGETIGDLFIEVFSNGTWQTAGSISGQQQAVQTDPWEVMIVDLTPYVGDTVSIRFRGVRGSSYTGDIAIDDIMLLLNGIGGQTMYHNFFGTIMDAVDVTLTPGGATQTSAEGGLFLFTPLANNTYTLSATTTAATGGINTTDALWALLSSVSAVTLDPLQTEAADVNNDAAVTAADAMFIQQYFLELINTWPGTGLWQSMGPLVTVNDNLTIVDLHLLGTGDVNRSFLPGMKAANNVLLFSDEVMSIPAWREVEIPVYAAQAMELGAVSLDLGYPSSHMRITGVSLANGQEVLWQANNGKLNISWMDIRPMEAIPGSELFTIRAIVTTSQQIGFTSGVRSEFADGQARVIDNAAISIPKLEATAIPEDLSLSSYPNPSQGISTLTYAVPEAGMVTLSIYNALGDKVAELVNASMLPGVYTAGFDGSNLPAGVYVGKLDLNGMSSSLRMIIRH